MEAEIRGQVMEDEGRRDWSHSDLSRSPSLIEMEKLTSQGPRSRNFKRRLNSDLRAVSRVWQCQWNERDPSWAEKGRREGKYPT